MFGSGSWPLGASRRRNILRLLPGRLLPAARAAARLPALCLLLSAGTARGAETPVPEAEIARWTMRASVQKTAKKAEIRETTTYIVNVPGPLTTGLETVAVSSSYLVHPGHCRVKVHGVNGRRRSWVLDEFVEIPASAGGPGITDARMFILNVAPLVAGDTLTVDKALRLEPFLGFPLITLGDAALPCRNITLDIEIPRDLDGRVAAWNVPEPPERAESGGSSRWSLNLRDVPPAPDEERAPPLVDLLPTVSIGTSRVAWGASGTWEDLGKAYWEHARRAVFPIHPSDRLYAREVRAAAGALAATLDLVQTNVRYVSVQLGEGGWIPSPADEVLRRRYGDCKDMTALVLSLLEGRGVEASMALVLTRPPASLRLDPLPSLLIFNHAVAIAPSGDDLVWLDATDPAGTTTSPRWDILGSPALIVSGPHAGYTRIPLAAPTGNQVTRRIRAVRASETRWDVQVTGSMTGVMAAALDNVSEDRGDEQAVRLLLSGFRPSGEEAWWDDIVLEDLVRTPEGIRFSLRLPPAARIGRLEDRSAPVRIPQDPVPFLSVFKRRSRATDVVWPVALRSIDSLLVETSGPIVGALPDTSWTETVAGLTAGGEQISGNGFFLLTRTIELADPVFPVAEWAEGRRLNQKITEWAERSFVLDPD